MADLFILTGLPGAGKSTFSEILMTFFNDVKYISSDKLRKEFKEYKDNHIKIFEIMDKMTIESLQNKKNVIYDSTNLEIKYRLELYKKIKCISSKIKVVNVFIHNGLDRAIYQSNQRKGRSDVSKQLIIDMYKTMQIPFAGVDCDIIMVPEIKSEDKQFKLYDSRYYNKNDMKEFLKYIKSIDSDLIKRNNMEEISR